MSLIDVIGAFATPGPYTVTRTAAGGYTLGRYAIGAISTLSIEASIQPAKGRDLKSLPEGERGDAANVLYTRTELFTRAPGREADTITFKGEIWSVVNVELWEAFGERHFRCIISRRPIP